jgi:hypothetical protein
MGCTEDKAGNVHGCARNLVIYSRIHHTVYTRNRMKHSFLEILRLGRKE